MRGSCVLISDSLPCDFIDSRVISQAFFHWSIFHIGMNMITAYYLCSDIERKMGTLTLLGQTGLFSVLCGFTYLLMQYIGVKWFKKESYYWTCAAGFSGVLFAFF